MGYTIGVREITVYSVQCTDKDEGLGVIRRGSKLQCTVQCTDKDGGDERIGDIF